MDKKGIDKDFSESYVAANAEQATVCFKTAAERLQNVNEWHLFAGKGSAVFQRMNKEGYALTGPVQEGDYIRIDIPGPGASSHFDWVMVEEITRQDSDISFHVRPCDDPTKPSDETAHFLSSAATSHFSVHREGNIVTASIAGRNEQPNTEGEGIASKIRNVLTGIGAIAGASNIQWNKLVKGLVTFDD